MSYIEEQPKNLTNSYSQIVQSDMWYYNLFHCINNCSLHGNCFYGFCICDVGYYGDDCSNISCPGTFCYYNFNVLEQICVHGCQAGYMHTDTDVYVPDIAKVGCNLNNMAQYEINGICDGFSHTQCVPPFVGEDCSIKDCKNNCSFNGWCSIEYPVSRCMCSPGYYGEICDKKICLNNCSYPHGLCNSSSGVCQCRMMYSPYNNTRPYHPWAGEDCSYLFAYSAGNRLFTVSSFWLSLVLILILCIYISDGFNDQNHSLDVVILSSNRKPFDKRRKM